MNILVTGSEGSLMQFVIPLLVKKEYNVIGIDIKESLENSNTCNYKFYQRDCRNIEELKDVFSITHFDFVIHAAATIYGIVGFHKFGADIISNDIISTINLLRCSVDSSFGYNVNKFIFISSSMVYEQVPKDCNNIDLFPAPKTYYGLSKYTNEKLCRAYYSQYHLPYIIWRPFNIITPYEKAGDIQGFSHVFADFIQQIVIDRKEAIDIIGDGKQVRCFTWIEEIAEAISNLSFGSEQGEFNLGNVEPITMIELAKLIHRIAKYLRLIPNEQSLRFKHLPALINDVRYRVPDMNLTKETFNWQAKCKIKDSIMKCLMEYNL